MKRILFVIIWVTIAIIYVLIAQRTGRTERIKLFNTFDSAYINGELEYVKIMRYAWAFKIKGDDEEFIFDPITGRLNENTIFGYLVNEGDTVIKEAYSDTLKVKINSKVYSYTFREPKD